MKCFESALEAACSEIFSCGSWQVDGKMNLASKNLGAVYGSMGRMAPWIHRS